MTKTAVDITTIIILTTIYHQLEDCSVQHIDSVLIM